MTPDEFRQYLDDLARQHNGRAGEPRIIDPDVEITVTSAKGTKVVTGTEPNPTPTYEFRFRDNTYIRVKGTGGDPGTSQAGSYQIVGGTAGVKPGASQEAPILRDTLTGIKRWEEESKSLVDVPGGEKEPPDPIDAAWKKNLDRIEQQQRITKAAEATRPPEPSVSTSAQFIPEWDEKTKTWVWKPNRNYVAPTPPQGRKPSSETMAEDLYRSSLRIQEIEAESKARLEAALKQEIEMYRLGFKELPEVTRTLDALLKKELAGLEHGYTKIEAEYQSQLRVGEFEKTQKPFLEAELGMKREAADLARGQAQAAVLTKQAEAGQAAIARGSALGVKTPLVALKMAFSPMQQALAILQRGQETGELDQNMMPVAQPQPLPEQQQALTAPPTAPPPTAPPVAAAPSTQPWEEPNYRTPLGWPGR